MRPENSSSKEREGVHVSWFITDSRILWAGLAALSLPLAFKLYRKIRPYTPEIAAVFVGMGPNALRWCWRTRVAKTISCTPLQTTLRGVAHRADLFYHGNHARGTTGYPTLLLHGDDGGHSFNTLHLADRALQAKKGPIYSFRVTYQDTHPQPHRDLLGLAIDHIEKTVREKDIPIKIIGVGYSNGCAELAYRAYVLKDIRIAAIISIAGRFKVTTGVRAPKPEKRPMLTELEVALSMKARALPHYQIAAGEDWCIPQEASMIPGDEGRLIPHAMHINVIFDPTALAAFDAFYQKATS